MEYFLWVFVVLVGLSCLGQFMMLYFNDIRQRTWKSVLLDLVCNTVLVCWAVALLIGGGQ